MKIHTDKLTGSDVYGAAARAGSDIDVELVSQGSRSRDHAFTVHLVAEHRPGRRRSNSGHRGAGYDYAATWDEWGDFLAALFQTDPHAIAGPYDGREDFAWQTGARYFQESYPPCDQHRWTWDGGPRRPIASRSPVGRPIQTYTCSKDCGAVRRHRAKS